MIETSQLRCFLAVAEELHFGRAAERLNMTQPPLSRQIQILERNMGCRLFIRTSRSVTLTDAGVCFQPEARRILRLLDNAQNMVRDVSLGRGGTLRCGFTAATAYRFLPELIQGIKSAIPEASLELHEMVSGRQLEALDSGEIELGLLRPPIERGHLESRVVTREKMLLAVPAGHDLAERDIVQWKDLNEVDFIMYGAQEARYFHDLISVFLMTERVQPNIVQRLSQIHSILSLVRAGVGIAIVPSSSSVLGIADVEFRPLGGETNAYAELCAVWRKKSQNPLLPLVVELARSRLG